MTQRWLVRSSVAAGAAVALALGTTGPAHAADTQIFLYHNGHQLGHMYHSDPDPDTITVCDDYADGHGVRGVIFQAWGVQWRPAGVIDDGGDANCDSVVAPIVKDSFWKMQLCWTGADNVCVSSKMFTE
ncbi:hypothetical protein AB0L33_17720 [Streptomyces sp. NPDC052299]|uniref:hypothetical protein n=1 Tax=Streptomyces sp. NPDC052299 TaxID=3155054 RepID=UPI00342AA232